MNINRLDRYTENGIEYILYPISGMVGCFNQLTIEECQHENADKWLFGTPSLPCVSIDKSAIK